MCVIGRSSRRYNLNVNYEQFKTHGKQSSILNVDIRNGGADESSRTKQYIFIEFLAITFTIIVRETKVNTRIAQYITITTLLIYNFEINRDKYGRDVTDVRQVLLGYL